MAEVLAQRLAAIEADALSPRYLSLNVSLDGKFKWVDDELVFLFGQYQGESLRWVADCDPGYLEWMAAEFTNPGAKNVACLALKGSWDKLTRPLERIPRPVGVLAARKAAKAAEDVLVQAEPA